MKLKTLFLSLVCFFGLTLPIKAQTKISILGDSYSTFVGHVYPETNECWYGTKEKRADQAQSNVSQLDETWWRLLLKKMNARMEYNNSYSGATICHTGYEKRDYSDRSFVTRMYNLGNPDVIIIMGGTNDDWAGAPLGEPQYKDWTNKDLFQFRPAFCYLLHHLKMLYPNVRICNVSNCDISKDVTQSMAEICQYYGIENIQLEKIDKLGGHPSVKGMQMVCDQIYDTIK